MDFNTYNNLVGCFSYENTCKNANPYYYQKKLDQIPRSSHAHSNSKVCIKSIPKDLNQNSKKYIKYAVPLNANLSSGVHYGYNLNKSNTAVNLVGRKMHAQKSDFNHKPLENSSVNCSFDMISRRQRHSKVIQSFKNSFDEVIGDYRYQHPICKETKYRGMSKDNLIQNDYHENLRNSKSQKNLCKINTQLEDGPLHMSYSSKKCNNILLNGGTQHNLNRSHDNLKSSQNKRQYLLITSDSSKSMETVPPQHTAIPSFIQKLQENKENLKDVQRANVTNKIDTYLSLITKNYDQSKSGNKTKRNFARNEPPFIKAFAETKTEFRRNPNLLNSKSNQYLASDSQLKKLKESSRDSFELLKGELTTNPDLIEQLLKKEPSCTDQVKIFDHTFQKRQKKKRNHLAEGTPPPVFIQPNTEDLMSTLRGRIAQCKWNKAVQSGFIDQSTKDSQETKAELENYNMVTNVPSTEEKVNEYMRKCSDFIKSDSEAYYDHIYDALYEGSSKLQLSDVSMKEEASTIIDMAMFKVQSEKAFFNDNHFTIRMKPNQLNKPVADQTPNAFILADKILNRTSEFVSGKHVEMKKGQNCAVPPNEPIRPREDNKIKLENSTRLPKKMSISKPRLFKLRESIHPVKKNQLQRDEKFPGHLTTNRSISIRDIPLPLDNDSFSEYETFVTNVFNKALN